MRFCVFVFFSLVSISTGQSDTSSINPNKIIENPTFFGIQIEAVSALAINELGISADYDLYSSLNKKYNFGLRLGAEYYKVSNLNVGGGSSYGPYMDFSIFGRYSHRGSNFWFSPLLGLSLHTNLEDQNSFTEFILKYGLELKYNLAGKNVGLLLKFVNGSTKHSGYGGIGIMIGFYNN